MIIGAYSNDTFFNATDNSTFISNSAVADTRNDAVYHADKAVAAIIWLAWVMFLLWPVILFFIPMLFWSQVARCDSQSPRALVLRSSPARTLGARLSRTWMDHRTLVNGSSRRSWRH